ncbi:uncharacterized protein EURHEDRAFT_178717 [Aspergillus ruber CBS 135680]|uniref:Uncharacterized protein n=1 Tax=Aspergillus ruber (strain CBS 135680) TaxID=1388766 RepID=A0A017S6U4_ASPRC|nr:uncharacterized protein EURHEDRAFT_178717 [Aspergillus ruber CBS 135680]EYE92763.1 hypothetical protein EURHEDRAFT_178717 [Aspergillus ruber CBS 135680]
MIFPPKMIESASHPLVRVTTITPARSRSQPGQSHWRWLWARALDRGPALARRIFGFSLSLVAWFRAWMGHGFAR